MTWCSRWTKIQVKPSQAGSTCYITHIISFTRLPRSFFFLKSFEEPGYEAIHTVHSTQFKAGNNGAYKRALFRVALRCYYDRDQYQLQCRLNNIVHVGIVCGTQLNGVVAWYAYYSFWVFYSQCWSCYNVHVDVLSWPRNQGPAHALVSLNHHSIRLLLPPLELFWPSLTIE